MLRSLTLSILAEATFFYFASPLALVAFSIAAVAQFVLVWTFGDIDNFSSFSS